MRWLAGVDIYALFLANNTIHRDASYGSLSLILDFLLGLSCSVPVTEKELALSNLLLELFPRVALFDTGLSEIHCFLIDILLYIHKKVLDIFVHALK